jgi:hypothetical protein
MEFGFWNCIAFAQIRPSRSTRKWWSAERTVPKHTCAHNALLTWVVMLQQQTHGQLMIKWYIWTTILCATWMKRTQTRNLLTLFHIFQKEVLFNKFNKMKTSLVNTGLIIKADSECKKRLVTHHTGDTDTWDEYFVFTLFHWQVAFHVEYNSN